MRKIWTGLVVVGCSIFYVLPRLAFSQEPAQFESLLASAQHAQASSDFQAAAEFYRQAVALHPEMPELRANLGLMYYQTGKDEQATEAFRQAIRLKPALFVPNLFLGLEYVKLKRFNKAIFYLNRAAAARPSDVQAQLGLGQAYAVNGKTRLASASYSRAAQLAPGNADAWYHLGVNYLEQVEGDARILLTRHKDSPYVHLLMAETFAEQRAHIHAEGAYKKVLSFPNPPVDSHAMYGFVLLNRHNLPAAQRELDAELQANRGSLVAKLGVARLHLEKGETEKAAQEIDAIWEADPGFLRSNISFLCAGLVRTKRSELQSALERHQAAGDLPPEVIDLFRNGTTPAGIADQSLASRTNAGPPKTSQTSAGNAANSYAKGHYAECTDSLAARLAHLRTKELRLLASCAYSTGYYRNVSDAAIRLASNPSTEDEGLYWEIKSAQKLATSALARASETDRDSSKLHVLLGDIFRQRKLLKDAEQEYRKALALQPNDVGALFGLSLALLASGRNDEALNVAQGALKKGADDPELNAVMGEILCVQRDFSGAEPYLKKSLNTKPEFVARVHALLGKVYAQTNRIQEAIAELKLGLATDKDGGLHYQIARLYLQVGDRDSARKAFEVSKRLQQEGLIRASVAMEQGEVDTESQ